MNNKASNMYAKNIKITNNLQSANLQTISNQFCIQPVTPNLCKVQWDKYTELDNEICKLIITKEFINNILEFSINYKTEVTYINNGSDVTFRIIWFISGNQLELKINNSEIVWNNETYFISNLSKHDLFSKLLTNIKSELYTFNLINC